MKKLVYIAGVTALAMSASAALLNDFEFNDASGTTLPGAAQSVAGAGTWSYDNGAVTANGSGDMVWSDGGNFYPQSSVAGSIDSGIVRFSMVFSAADIPTSNGEITFNLKSASSDDSVNSLGYVQLRNHDGKDIRLVFGKWTSGAPVLEVGANSLQGPVTVWADIDLDNDQTFYHYTYQGKTVDMETPTSITAGSVVTSLTSAWQGMDAGGNTVSMDYIKVETVPEPASLALVGFLGGSILFIRRRFMI